MLVFLYSSAESSSGDMDVDDEEEIAGASVAVPDGH